MENELHIDKMIVNVRAHQRNDRMNFVQEITTNIRAFVLPILDEYFSSDQLVKKDISLDRLELNLSIKDPNNWSAQIAQAIYDQIVVQIESEVALEEVKQQLKLPLNGTDYWRKRLETGIYNQGIELPHFTNEQESIEFLNFLHFLYYGHIPSTKNAAEKTVLPELEQAILSSSHFVAIASTISQLVEVSPPIKTRFFNQMDAVKWMNLLESSNLEKVKNSKPSLSHLVTAKLLSTKELFTTLSEQLKDTRKFGKLGTVFQQDLQHATGYSWKELIAQLEAESLSSLSIFQCYQIIADERKTYPKELEASVQQIIADLEVLLFKLTGDFPAKLSRDSIISNAPSKSDLLVDSKEAKSTPQMEWVINNAGIVLLTPFVSTLLKNLKLVDEKLIWNDPLDQVRAIYLLHYFATGSIEITEDQLVLQKVLMGYDLEHVLPSSELVMAPWFEEYQEQVLQEERDILAAVQSNWPPMKNCTWGGLRNDFLSRSGTFIMHENGQHSLRLETHGLDVLLPFKNWGITPIKYPWIEGLINVHWK